MTATEADPPGRRQRFMAMARLGQGGAGREVANLASGTVIAQVIMMVSQLAIARLYTPEERAVMAVIVAVAGVLAIGATLRIEMAVPLTHTDEEAEEVARLAMVLAGIVAVVVAGVTVAVLVASPMTRAKYGASAWLLPGVLWAQAAFTILRSWQARKKLFRQSSDANVVGTLATAGAQVAAGLAGSGAGGLTFGYGLGRLASSVMMVLRSRLRVRGRIHWSLLRSWRQFPTWALVPAVLNAASVGAVAPVMNLLYGDTITGQFSQAYMLLAAPAVLLGQAVASVFYVRFAAMDRESQDTSRHMVGLAQILLAISVPVFVPIVLLGPELFSLLLSSTWRQAGVLATLLSPWLMLNFVSSPISGYATVKNQMQRLFVLGLIETVARLGPLAIGRWWGGPEVGIGAYSAAGAIISCYYIVWVLRLSGASSRRSLSVLVGAVATLAVALVVAAFGRGPLGVPLYVAASVVVSLVVAGVSAYRVLGVLRTRVPS